MTETGRGSASPAAPAGTALLVAVAVLWIVPGLFGHQPWKPDEGYTIGLVQHAVESGDWVVPTLTGEPFVEKPPIFFMTTALLAKALPPDRVPLHQTMALAAALYVGLTFLFAFLAAATAGGRRAGAAAVLGLMGCLGLVVRAHSAITDTALWCGFAAALYGMALFAAGRRGGAWWFGTGAGLTFLAKGLLGPAFLGAGLVLLPLFAAGCRSGRYLRFLAWGFVFSLPWLVLWPLALYSRSPELFGEWFWTQNVGRFLGEEYGFARKATSGHWTKYLLLFPWFTLPLWPPALLAWLRRGRAALADVGFLYPTLVTAAGMAALSAADTRRELYMIPLLIPLAVLAARAEGPLPRWLDALLRRLPLLLSGIGLAALWLAWAGWRLEVPWIMARLEARAPGAPGAGNLAAAAAAGYTAAWFWLLFRRRLAGCWQWVWACGVMAVWGVAMLLYMPILDHVKGFHDTFAAMARHIPADQRAAVERMRFGESERAVLDYDFGIRTRWVKPGEERGEFLIIQYNPGDSYTPGEGWELVWEGWRPGDRKKPFRLYRNPGAERPLTPETEN